MKRIIPMRGRPRRGVTYVRSASTIYDRIRRINMRKRQNKDNGGKV